MITFITEHRDLCGVEPICKTLQIAPSTYYTRIAIARNPALASKRARQDVDNRKKIKNAYDDSGKRYGARKIWHGLRKGGEDIAKCTVERLMNQMQTQGVVRGKKVVTTNPDTSQSCPRPSDLLCMRKLAHASFTKEYDDNDNFQRSFRRTAERC